MPLSGTFTTMPFPDLLQWLSDSRRSGVLTVSLEFEERFLRFSDGCVAGVEGDDPRQRELGRVLVETGILDEETLRRGLDRVEETGRPLARILLQDGRLSTDQLDRGLTLHATRVILGIFLWREGRFSFNDGGPSLLGLGFADTLLVEQPIPIRSLLMEGMRRLDEWQRIVEIFPSDYCQVHALGNDPTLPIIDELFTRGEPVALGELWARGGDRYRVYEELFKAYAKGLLAVDTQAPADGQEPDRSPVDVLVQNGEVLLEERQYDEAVALLRGALNLDPSRHDVRLLLTRAHDEQLGELYQTIPPYKIPVLKVPREQLTRFHLSQRERHLAERLNGRWDVGALVVVTPLGELETMRALKKLLHVGAMKFLE